MSNYILELHFDIHAQDFCKCALLYRSIVGAAGERFKKLKDVVLCGISAHRYSLLYHLNPHLVCVLAKPQRT
jgi:hypothetical protein